MATARTIVQQFDLDSGILGRHQISDFHLCVLGKSVTVSSQGLGTSQETVFGVKSHS